MKYATLHEVYAAGIESKMQIFMLILVFASSVKIGDAAQNVVRVNFTKLQSLCYDEAKYLQPLVSSGSNLTIRTLTGVADKRMCAVECVLLPDCAGFQHKPSSKVCFLATACEFQGKWKTSGSVCETEFAFDRNVSCAIPQWVKDLNVSALYNFRRGPSNVVDVTKHRLVEMDTGLTFDIDGANCHGTGYLQMNTDDVLELTNLLQYQRQWTIWVRLKRNANNQYTPILQSVNYGNAYQVIKFVFNYDKVMLRLWDSVRLIDEVTTPVITTNFSHWIDVAMAFNGTSFTIIVNGQIVTGRTQNDNN